MGVGALEHGAAPRRAVFLDRDGVLNRAAVRGGKPYPPQRIEELEVLPRVPEALGALRAAGYLLIVVTNQPDVARGTQQRSVVEAMNRSLQAQLPLDDVRVCYHDAEDGCECRKPRPGLLQQAARCWGIDLSSSYMVGDRWKDVECGRRAGCRTVFLDHGYAEPRPPLPDCTVHSLYEAAEWILGPDSSIEGGRVREADR